MNASKKGYLAPECEESIVLLEAGFMGASMYNQGGKSTSETYDEEVI